jgi:hypothetical protein
VSYCHLINICRFINVEDEDIKGVLRSIQNIRILTKEALSSSRNINPTGEPRVDISPNWLSLISEAISKSQSEFFVGCYNTVVAEFLFVPQIALVVSKSVSLPP